MDEVSRRDSQVQVTVCLNQSHHVIIIARIHCPTFFNIFLQRLINRPTEPHCVSTSTTTAHTGGGPRQHI